jgi:hypothetical protein
MVADFVDSEALRVAWSARWIVANGEDSVPAFVSAPVLSAATQKLGPTFPDVHEFIGAPPMESGTAASLGGVMPHDVASSSASNTSRIGAREGMSDKAY